MPTALILVGTIDWLIRVLRVSAIFQPCNGGYKAGDNVVNVASNICCSLCRSKLPRKRSSYYSDRSIIEDIRFLFIFELILTSTQT